MKNRIKITIRKNLQLNQFLYLRAQIGHRQQLLHKTMNSYISGFQQNIAILNIHHILLSWERVSRLFSRIFLYRQKFLILAANKNIPNDWLQQLLEWKFYQQNKQYPFYLGYIGTSWSGGIISNWFNLWSFVLLVFKNLVSQKHVSKTKYSLIKKLGGRIARGHKPTFPDFVLSFSSEQNLLREVKNMRLLSVTLNDSDANLALSDFLMFGNDDSFLLLELTIKLLEQNFLEGSREEQELFYRMIFKKLKTLL